VFTGKDGGIIHFKEISGEEACSTYANEKFLRNLQQSYSMQPTTEKNKSASKNTPKEMVLNKILQHSHKSQCQLFKE
jgi:NADPH-dependent 7-cyano-7-deazaguanine reductase QueF